MQHRPGLSITLVATTALVAAFAMACGGPEIYEIPIETPIQAKMDVSAFQRVLIAGFVAGGTEDVDANQETVRLLRSQLRSKSSLKVIDADILPLIDVAQDQSQANAAASDEGKFVALGMNRNFFPAAAATCHWRGAAAT